MVVLSETHVNSMVCPNVRLERWCQTKKLFIIRHELYEWLDTNEGENILYRLAIQWHQAGKDVQQVRMMKDKHEKDGT